MWVVCPCVCDCLQKTGKGIRTPGLELEVIVNHLLWMLGTKSFFVCKSIRCVNDRGIFPVPTGIITKDQPLLDQFSLSD